MELDYSSSDCGLPSYSSSSPLPSYSCELARGERLLQHTPRSRPTTQPTSVFIKKAGKTTIILNDQEEDATIPVYGRRGLISGNLVLEKSENILDVVLKVEGKMDATITDGGGNTTKLLADTYTLWSHTSSQDSTCPSQIPFSVLLPASFKHKGTSVPLPPTYNVAYYNLPSLFVRCGYQIHIIVSRLRHQKVGSLWPKTKHILIPFTYTPRTRAHRPIVPAPCFFSSVKTLPEEWYQAVTYLKTRPTCQVPPISAHLFIPGGRVYGLGDTIPFHVQLSGHTSSLRELFSGAMLDRVMSVDSQNTQSSTQSTKKSSPKPLLQINILRQTSVCMSASNAWKTAVLAEASMTPVPPDLMSWYSPDESSQESHIDWEGELRMDSEVTVGGFLAGNVQVKDFICLTLSPPRSSTQPFLELQLTVPVRFVSDSFSEAPGLEEMSEPSASAV
ncbi:hypothetical protein BDN70DRAFT_873780 [Pholiota conissans]|uniref:Uncharacterized protein n=1 Tax=Pholiota conissans TaxID=109636 RepID=A0A9P5Z9U3_9AGAR|nr:hypothetical protein BDN70DRAFT_873780 [Pholiota conissans]